MWQCRLDDPGYSAPVYLRLPTILLFILSGFAVSSLLNVSLGDATWGVSTGDRLPVSIACAYQHTSLDSKVAPAAGSRL